MTRRSRALLALPLFGALACVAPRPSDTVVVDAYRRYAQGDCAAVKALLEGTDFSGQGAERKPLFELLQGYCLELAGDVSGAKTLYASVIAHAPRTVQGFEAALRLRDIKRLELQGTSREEFNQRITQQWETPLYKHGVKPIHRMDPTYPSAINAAHIAGRVVVDFEISNEGTVVDPIVVITEPPFVFDGSALAAVRHWIYEPSTTGERKRVAVVLAFKLRD